MKKSNFILGSIASVTLLYASFSQAESLIDGVYKSAGDANGKGQCTLVITSLEQSHKYGDELFELESSGEGACEWSALGMSKNYSITAGSVTNGGAHAFVKVTFPFGPAGKKIEITSYDLDGSVRNNEEFSKQDDNMVAGN